MAQRPASANVAVARLYRCCARDDSDEVRGVSVPSHRPPSENGIAATGYRAFGTKPFAHQRTGTADHDLPIHINGLWNVLSKGFDLLNSSNH